jgi:hypothetical protein
MKTPCPIALLDLSDFGQQSPPLIAVLTDDVDDLDMLLAGGLGAANLGPVGYDLEGSSANEDGSQLLRCQHKGCGKVGLLARHLRPAWI